MNTELDCVMLYLIVSLDDHQGHENVLRSRQLLMGPRNYALIDSFVIAQLGPRQNPECTEKWRDSLLFSQSFLCIMSFSQPFDGSEWLSVQGYSPWWEPGVGVLVDGEPLHFSGVAGSSSLTDTLAGTMATCWQGLALTPVLLHSSSPRISTRPLKPVALLSFRTSVFFILPHFSGLPSTLLNKDFLIAYSGPTA